MALSIAAVTMSWALPNWMDFVRNQRLQAAQSSLATSLAQARSHAIKYHVPVVICPGTSAGCSGSNQWHDGWVAFEDSNRNRRKDANETLLLLEEKSGRPIRIISSTQRQRLRFTAMGFSHGSNASIWLCDERGNNYGRSVIIANSGRIRQQNHTSRCQ